MKKPKQKIIKHYDYYECAKYIAHKLGVENLDDFAGKFNGNPDADLLCFWYCICDVQQPTNPSYVWIDVNWDWPDWAIPIVNAFEEEFGPDRYWVEW